MGDADPELAFPVVEGPGCGVEEGVAPDVALRDRPVSIAGEQS